MFFKKKKRKRFLCLRILCFSEWKKQRFPEQVMSNYLNIYNMFRPVYGWHAQKIQKLTPAARPEPTVTGQGKGKGRIG